MRRKLDINKLILIIIPIIIIGTTVAKYVQKQNNDIVYQAKNFYFESDLLSDNTNPKSYTYQKGKNNISIILRNNIDSLRYSEVDIDYIVTISDIQGKKIEEKTGTLSNKNIDAKQIEFTNLQSGTYTVVAKSKNPYEKTLQANFIIEKENDEIVYQISDSQNSPVLQLTVITEDYDGDIKISWPSGVAPDSTDDKFSDVNIGYNGGNKVVNFNSNSEYTFQFFKQNPNLNYNKNDFTVERGQ